MTVLVRLSAALAVGERLACRVLLSGLVVLLVSNVALRYLFNRPLFFAEEVAALMLVWTAFLAVLVSLSRGEQVAVTLAVERLPLGAARAVALIVTLITILIFAALGYAAALWVTSPVVEFDQVISLDSPKQPFYLIVPFFCVAAIIHTLARLAAPRGTS